MRGVSCLGPNLEWFSITHWKLPPGWNKAETTVLVQIPPGYPVTPPDNFYTDNDLALANGQQPGNSSVNQLVASKMWRMFSYHVEGRDWHPHADPLKGHNLLTFLYGVAKRLAEVS
jgi:hypothetical protein